jgi:2-C-methyl-D-erythritol 4-phosphate cytidylyltransferase
MRIYAIILSAGQGERLQEKLPKGFLKLKGKPLFLWSLEVFDQTEEIQGGILVVPENWEEEAQKYLVNLRNKWLIRKGGPTRQESSFLGLLALEPLKPDYVLIHDGARPFLKKELVQRLIREAPQAVIPVLPAQETLIEADENWALKTVDRKRIKIVQTPQGFPYRRILEAHRLAQEEGLTDQPDDSSIYLRYGGRVKLVQGDWLNLKITFPEDLKLANSILRWENEEPSL